MTLLRLIQREIEDNIAYFVGAMIFSVILIIVSVSLAATMTRELELELFLLWVSVPIVIVLSIGFPSMGISQMYHDKNRKISSFLLTLPVTRRQILLAKIAAGILAILTFFVPIIVTALILYEIFKPPLPILEGCIFDVSSVLLLTAMAAYCIGLLFGWSSSKLVPFIGSLLFTAVIVTLIIIKGFGLHIWVILGFFILASLIRIRQKFFSTAL